MNTTHDLSVLFDNIWQDINQAVDGSHPWQYPVIANAVAHNQLIKAEQRIVVLRDCDDELFRLFFHTDSRSAKFKQLQENNRLHWNFWNPDTRVQLRLDTEVVLHHQCDISDEAWENTSPGSLKVYSQVLPPACHLKTPEPPYVLCPETRYTHEDLVCGKPFFALVEARVLTLDWLCIASEPHQRAFFKRESAERVTWQKCWSTP